MYKPLAFEELLNLSGKVALITGAAGGIGEGVAQRLHQAGATVVIGDMNADGAKAVADALNGTRPNSAMGVGLDVSKADQVTDVITQIVTKFGSIDILVNNAGIYPMKPFAEMAEADFMKVIDVNLRGVFLCTKAATEEMKKKGNGGKVINITSIDAIHPSMVGLAHYDSSKHGVWGFTKNIALELAKDNITVNAIAPGGVATPGTGSKDGTTPPGFEAFVKAIPMGRFGNSDEIGKVALFLASDMASYMTGEQVVVDGGRLLG